jgi:hypothetical protein
MGKEFKKSFMHPTRRKLVEMVQTGEYAADAKIGWDKEYVTRNIGDIWEDEFHKYEKKDGYILKTSKNSDALQEVRDYIQFSNECKNSKCETIKFTKTHKTLIKKTGYCANCLAEMEHNFRVNDLWKEYEDYKIFTRMIIDGRFKLEQIEQSRNELQQTTEYINEDGTTETWTLPYNVDELRIEMDEFIENSKKELEQIENLRNEAFNTIKSKNLEHYL